MNCEQLIVNGVHVHNSQFASDRRSPTISHGHQILPHLQQRRSSGAGPNQRPCPGQRHRLPGVLPAHLRQPFGYRPLALAQQRRSRLGTGVQRMYPQLQAPRLGPLQSRLDQLKKVCHTRESGYPLLLPEWIPACAGMTLNVVGYFWGYGSMSGPISSLNSSNTSPGSAWRPNCFLE